MTSPGSAAGKRRSLSHLPNSEDQELNIIAQEAESRLANSQAVLAEARKLRTCERERLRQAENESVEEDENEADHTADCETGDSQPTRADESSTVAAATPATPGSPAGPQSAAPTPVATVVPSKRLATDDTHTNSGAPIRSRLLQQQQPSVDLEEKHRRLMIANAQLDNEKHVLRYEVETLKDRLCDEEERYLELQHKHMATCRDLKEQKGSTEEWKTKATNLKDLLSQREALIKEHGLLFVSVGDSEATSPPSAGSVASALLSVDSAELLADYEGTLGERLHKFFQEKVRLEDENKRLQRDLEMEKSRAALGSTRFLPAVDGVSVPGSPSVGGMDTLILDVETQRNVTEYKLKLKRAEQEITTLQGAVTRLECQVTRYKTSSETSEKNEEDLKQEKRRLQKELREVQELVQELETKNGHLSKRMEKAKYRNVSDTN